jgi:hypothetical protein
MKNIYLITSFLFLTLIFNSCSKESSSSSPEKAPITTNNFKCKVNGVLKTFGTNKFLSNGQVKVIAYVGDSTTSTENIWLDVDENSTTNWYFKYFDVTKQFLPSSDFVLVITNNNTTTRTLKGTFSGTVVEVGLIGFTNSKSLTEGVFDINY